AKRRCLHASPLPGKNCRCLCLGRRSPGWRQCPGWCWLDCAFAAYGGASRIAERTLISQAAGGREEEQARGKCRENPWWFVRCEVHRAQQLHGVSGTLRLEGQLQG